MSKTSSDPINDIPDFAPKGARSIRSVLSSKKGLSFSLPEILGAVTISVIGLGAIGFGVGMAINSGHDATARGSLESLKSAQTLYYSQNEAYGTLDELTEGDSPALTGEPAETVLVEVSDNGRAYCAAVKSNSFAAPTFWVSSKGGAIVEEKPTDVGVQCPTP